MAFKHGTYSSEVPTQLQGMNIAQSPAVVIGIAPINMGDITSINRAELIMTPTEAQEKFGGINNLSEYSISTTLYTFMQIYGIKPIICINVLDPTRHKKTIQAFNKTIEKGKVKLEEIGILTDSLVIKNGEIKIEKEEYSFFFDSEGKLNLEFENQELTTLMIGFDCLDPSKVTKDDIIGGIDAITLETKGLEVLGTIFQKYSMIPSVVIAPGFSHDPEVRAILDTKSSKIGGKWGAMSIVNLPIDIPYGDLIKYKKDKNFIDEDQILTYGIGRLGEEFIPQDILLAALMNSVDASNGGVPFESPSNKNIKVEGISWKKDGESVDLNLDENQANLLNENGIVTIIQRPNGTVCWGNRTSIQQPGGTTDPKDTFIPAKRMFKYIANALMLNTEADVDRPMTLSKAENIKMKINMFLAGLVSEGKLLGGRIEFLESENPLVDMTNGRFKWHIYLGIVMPGEALEFILEYDTNYAKTFK